MFGPGVQLFPGEKETVTGHGALLLPLPGQAFKFIEGSHCADGEWGAVMFTGDTLA